MEKNKPKMSDSGFESLSGQPLNIHKRTNIGSRVVSHLDFNSSRFHQKNFIRQVRAGSHFSESIGSKEGSKNHEVPRIERTAASAVKVLQVCK